MQRILTLFALLALLSPARAQDGHDHPGHGHTHQDHQNADESPSTHGGDIEKALAAGGTLVEIRVLGMVCDFCATALTKTFGRREEVAAVQVDLDAKIVTVVLKKGQVLADSTIEKLVESAGYKIQSIRRPADGDVPPSVEGGQG